MPDFCRKVCDDDMPTSTSQIPFTTEEELNHQLTISTCGLRLERQDDPSSCRLPDQPRIRLNTPELNSYLQSELQTPALDNFAPYLWLLTTPTHTNISPLHHQLVKGRRIILTEDPQLHLLWVYNTIFIKPIPSYLLSHAFWTHFLSPQTSPMTPSAQQATFSAARGFLRSYIYLLKYKTDFDIATQPEMRLIPDIDNIDFQSLSDFLHSFSDLDASLISPRYHFGEIRFTRLKFWSSVFLHDLPFTFYGQYADHFQRFYAPLLFIFGVFTVVLSAMQVTIATNPGNWNAFMSASRWFSVVTILCVAIMTAGLLLKLFTMVGGEIVYSASKAVSKRRRAKGHNVQGVEIDDAS